MGCIARIGCLILLAILMVGGWLTRDRWMARLRHTPARVVLPAAPAVPRWEPLSDSGAERTQAALSKLSRPTGPVFATLAGGDVASYVFKALARRLPPTADSIEAAVVGGTVMLRASVRMADLGGASALGALGGVLGDRARVELTGTLVMIRPGLVDFQVDKVAVQGVAIPGAVIPGLLKRLVAGQRPAGLSDAGIPIEVPRFVGDLRVANGRVTLYKTPQ